MYMLVILVLCVQEEKGRPRRGGGKGPFGSLFGDHALACEFLGPQLLEFFVDIGECLLCVSDFDIFLSSVSVSASSRVSI